MGKGRKDHTLEALLDLSGETHFVDDKQSYWVKYEVTRIEPTDEKPHGIDYSLTLHDPTGKRILGYDNAHPTKATDGPGGKKTKSQDHKHRYDTVRPYKFTDAGTLMEDFWTDVEKLLKEKGVMK